MADDACCSNFGGLISIQVDTDRYAPTEADITLDVSNISVEAKANQDGSPCYMSKPKLFKAEVTFRNGCGLSWNVNLRKCKVNATISEDDNGRTHIFTGARFTGEPRLNLSDGTVSGITIEGPNYQMLNDNAA